MNKTLLFILAIIELVLKYGVPATLAIIRSWSVEDPTEQDIEALKALVPPPESYEASNG